jgi:hypothetical protein
MAFFADKDKGEEGEQIVADILSDKLCIDRKKIYKSDTENREYWDLFFRYAGNKYFFECKYDLGFMKTGNIAIETSKKTGKSGLSISKASHYVFLYGKKIRIIKTEELKKNIKDNIYTTTTGGDYNNSYLTLIPSYRLEKISTDFKDFLLDINIEK